ncbi:hypothetical protein JYT83_00695 [bacterium AH-315-F18]|nr:hypothetical protein [bacterium AH-315-F18]
MQGNRDILNTLKALGGGSFTHDVVTALFLLSVVAALLTRATRTADLFFVSVVVLLYLTYLLPRVLERRRLTRQVLGIHTNEVELLTALGQAREAGENINEFFRRREIAHPRLRQYLLLKSSGRLDDELPRFLKLPSAGGTQT